MARPYGDLFRTKLCKFFEENGNCPRGDRCTFAHGKHELRDAPNFGGDDRRRGRYSPRRDDREEVERNDYRRRTRSVDRGRTSRSPGRRHSRGSRSPQPDREERDRERRRSRHRSSERDREGDAQMNGRKSYRSPERADERERSPSKSPARDAGEERAAVASGEADVPDRDSRTQISQMEVTGSSQTEEQRSTRHEKRDRRDSSRSPSRKRSKSRRDDDKKIGDLESQISRLTNQVEHYKKKNLDVMEEVKEYEQDKRKAEEEAEDARRHANELQAKLANALADCGTREGRFKKYVPMVQHMLDRLKEDLHAFGEKDINSERVTVSVVKASVLGSEELQNLQISELQELEQVYWRALRNIMTAKEAKVHLFGAQKQLNTGG
eukprot:tig00000319_g24137.t1